MLRSRKFQAAHNQTAHGVCVLGLGVATWIAGVVPAIAQTSPQTGAATVPVVRPPVARQIEPMVSPVKRVAPKTVPPQMIAASQPAAGAALKTPSPQLAAGLAPPVVSAGAAQPAAPQKIVVYTCKIGQDFSEKLKACFTPGVTKVVSAAKAVKAKVGAEIENAKRSALGAAKKKS
jgi:hypothetical protein